MEDQSKERLATFLMEELLDRLGSRSDIKKLLGEMSGLPLEELLRSLINDFASDVEQRYLDYLQSRKATPVPDLKPPPEFPLEDTNIDAVDKFADRFEEVSDSGKEEIGESSKTGERNADAERPEESVLAPGEASTEAGELDESSRDVAEEIPEDEEVDTSGISLVGKKPQRLPCRYDDENAVYMHAVSMLRKDEDPALDPFYLEVKGLGAREFAVAVDYAGLRFYVSKINLAEMSVSKAGVLLLGKQESLQMQGVHEGILNDLRAYGTLLPFEYGTVARDKAEFFKKIDQNLDEIKVALLDVMATKWWTLSLSVLDAKIGQLVGSSKTPTERNRPSQRASYSSTPQPRAFDIKVLEKILQKEKKIAESVHTQLSAVAERSDIDMMVGLGSGSTEDWKMILKASYEVLPERMQHFYRAVTDVQYQYVIFDLMLSLAGKREFYSFARTQ